MDLIGIIIVLGIVGLVAMWYYSGKPKNLDVDQDGDVDINDAEKIVKDTAKGIKKDAKKVVQEVKSKLPTKSKLAAMKKADLENLGKEFGIDLDKRKTKDNMIKDLQKHVKTK